MKRVVASAVANGAGAGAAGGGLGLLVVLILGWAGVGVDGYEGAAIATGLAWAAAAVGRDGLVGIARRIWIGSSTSEREE